MKTKSVQFTPNTLYILCNGADSLLCIPTTMFSSSTQYTYRQTVAGKHKRNCLFARCIFQSWRTERGSSPPRFLPEYRSCYWSLHLRREILRQEPWINRCVDRWRISSKDSVARSPIRNYASLAILCLLSLDHCLMSKAYPIAIHIFV